MDLSAYSDPVFIAKLIDFVVFVAAIVYLYQRYLKNALVAHQELQNKMVEDAVAYRTQSEQSVADASRAIEQAKVDAAHMIEIGNAQADKLVVDERNAAKEHAQRIVGHAAGELDRERYRVRRELLEETVERATDAARGIVRLDVTPAKQDELVSGVLTSLESAHA
jgi:F0F1-type ATP synthase membrane subunit b/b'